MAIPASLWGEPAGELSQLRERQSQQTERYWSLIPFSVHFQHQIQPSSKAASPQTIKVYKSVSALLGFS